MSDWSNINKNPWSPSDKSAGVTLSNDDQDATGNLSNAWACARAKKGRTEKKWYWETKIIATDTNPGVAAMMDSGASLTTNPGGSASGWMAQHGGAIAFNGVTRDYATAMPSFAVNDIFGVAFDRVAGKAYLHRNGTYFNSGDPEAGTGSVISGMTSGSWFPAVGVFNSSNTIRIITDRVSFTYPLPVGYLPYGDGRWQD